MKTLKALAILTLLAGAGYIIAVRVKGRLAEIAAQEAAEDEIATVPEVIRKVHAADENRRVEFQKIETFNARGEWIWADPNWSDHFKAQMRELDSKNSGNAEACTIVNEPLVGK